MPKKYKTKGEIMFDNFAFQAPVEWGRGNWPKRYSDLTEAQQSAWNRSAVAFDATLQNRRKLSEDRTAAKEAGTYSVPALRDRNPGFTRSRLKCRITVNGVEVLSS